MVVQVILPEEHELSWRGEWTASVAYHDGDVVGRLGSSYRARRTTQNEDPAVSPSSWDPVALRGSQGDKGDKGDRGDQGVPGIAGTIERAFSLAQVWEWDHDLGTHPTVVTIDDDGGEIRGDVTYPSADVVRVDFGNVSFSGKMILG